MKQWNRNSNRVFVLTTHRQKGGSMRLTTYQSDYDREKANKYKIFLGEFLPVRNPKRYFIH